MTSNKKRKTSRASRPTPRGKSAQPKLKPLRDQVALRCRSGAELKVRSVLSALGRLEPYSPAGLLILHAKQDVTAARIQKTLARLEEQDLVEFVTPVMCDAESEARRVLTDEITVKLKAGAAADETLAALKTEHGVEVKRRNEFVPTQYVVSVPHPSGTRTLEVARSLDSRDDIEFAAPNFITDIKRQG